MVGDNYDSSYEYPGIKDYSIIDGHCHIGKYYLNQIPYCDLDELVKGINYIGIKKICISSFIGISDDYYLGNNVVAEAIKKYPDRIIGMACINPNKKETIEKELIRCFDILNMSLIKLHPVFSSCPMDSDNYNPVYEFASQRKLAILNHSWQDYKLLDRLSNKYPNINFIQAHNAGGWDGKKTDSFLELARSNDNVYVDIAYSIAYYGVFEKLAEYIGTDKIIYGSDYPMMDMGYQLGRVLYSNISKKDKKKIFGGNIRRIIEKLS